MCFLFSLCVFRDLRSACGTELSFGRGAVSLSGWVLTASQPLRRNWSVCLAASGWSTAACCIIIVCCPSPPLTSKYSQRKRRREWRKERQREGDWMNCIVCLAMLALHRPWVRQCPFTQITLRRSAWLNIFLRGSLWRTTLGFSYSANISLCVSAWLSYLQVPWLTLLDEALTFCFYYLFIFSAFSTFPPFFSCAFNSKGKLRH